MRGKAHPLISCLSSMKKGAKLAPGLFFTKVYILGEGHKIFEKNTTFILNYSCNKIIRPEFKFPAKIQMAFSPIVAIRGWFN